MPVGCLGSLTVFFGFIALIICLVFGAMKSSDVYKEAVLKAKSDQSVQEIIGVPIEERFFVTGNINIKNSSGRANLSIPIVGPEGKATIYVVAAKTAGKWTFSTLVVEIKKNKKRINLLEKKSN